MGPAMLIAHVFIHYMGNVEAMVSAIVSNEKETWNWCDFVIDVSLFYSYFLLQIIRWLCKKLYKNFLDGIKIII